MMNEKNCIITKDFVHTVVKERRKDIHKGDCGKVMIIAGTRGMAGAAVLAGTGAYRAGSGLVRICIEEELFPIIQTKLTEATCVPRSAALGDLSQFDAIAVGPGLGDEKENEKIIAHILSDFNGTVVIDADGLNTVARRKMAENVRNASCRVIMTPHEGEAARLLGTEVSDIKKNGRTYSAEMIAERYGAITVLKGAETVVTSEKGESYINSTGNAGMATGGSGDVLTGITVSFAGQGMDAFDAARAAVFIHGLAGDIGAGKISQHGLMAGDIAYFTSLAIREITGK